MLVGDRIGDYEIIGLLGVGGMGTVYKVRHTVSERMEALKVLLPDLQREPELAERFLREIKIQASLSHPHIAALHTAMRVSNQLVMVMELVEGRSLDHRIAEGPIPPPEAARYFVQALSALEYAHQRGVIHRDIKPENIMLLPDGTLKLMDFGIAVDRGSTRLTKQGGAMGSLYYMSPEQVRGAPVDGRSDLYSVGVTLYQAVTGRRPIDGGSEYAVMHGHLSRIPEPPAVGEPLRSAIMKALEKDPAHRFQSAAEFREALATLDPYSSSTWATGSAAAPLTPSRAQWGAETLERLRRDLAAHIGPLAKVLVDRAAKKATSLDELYQMLAEEVPAGPDRERFLKSRPK